MNVGSLFSGIGGIELGFEAEGFHTEWFVECEPYAQSVLKKNWPKATIYADVTSIDWSTVPKVDVLTGGFPCQDISIAGKGDGITGSRSSLWKYYCEAIRILRPKYALIENVSELSNRGLNVVLADLAKIGYDAEWHCVPASSVGAYHRRERIFILAYSNMHGCVESRFKVTTNKTEQQTQHDNRLLVSWASLSEIRRADDGLPCGAHRVKCLGNAVVPQVAQIFAQAIKEIESYSQDGGARSHTRNFRTRLPSAD